MSGGGGIYSSVGIAKETTFGTYAAPTRWVEHHSESIEFKPTRYKGKGLRNGGLVSRKSSRHTTSATVDGDIVTPVYSAGMGLWLAMIFGTMGITPTQQATSTAYKQAHTLQDNAGQSATIQVGRPSLDNVMNVYSYLGVKCTKAVFEAKQDQPLMLTLTLDGKDVDQTQTYVAPNYHDPNPELFWDQGNFTMAATFGSEAYVDGVRSFILTIDRTQDDKRFYMNGTGRKSEQRLSDFVKVTGEIETDFLVRTTFADYFYNDTPQSIKMNFTGGLIATGYNYALNLSLPCCVWDSEAPKVTGPNIIQPKMMFEVLDDETNPVVEADYISTDVTL